MGVHLGRKATTSILLAGLASWLALAVDEALPYFFGMPRPLPPVLQVVLTVVAGCFALLVLLLAVAFASSWAGERKSAGSLLDGRGRRWRSSSSPPTTT